MSNLNPEDVVFAQATTSGQLRAIWTLNAEAWAEPLSIQDHIEREQSLSEQEATGPLWKTWMLVLRQDPGSIVASCETFEKPVLWKDGTGLQRETGYAIASVFTNPKYRGNKMAALLLDRLKGWMDVEGNGVVSVLYSDIGPKFYEQLGWKPYSSITLVLETDPNLRESSKAEQIDLPSVKLLQQDDLRELCDKDIELLEADLVAKQTSGRISFVFLPTFSAISWHIAREDLNAKLIHGRCSTRSRGAISESGRVWIIWHFDEVEKKLKSQRLVILDRHERDRNVKELAALINSAKQDSEPITMLIWNPCEEVIEAAKVLVSYNSVVKLRLEEREGSIPSARLRGGSSSQAELIWEANEYYAWC